MSPFRVQSHWFRNCNELFYLIKANLLGKIFIISYYEYNYWIFFKYIFFCYCFNREDNRSCICKAIRQLIPDKDKYDRVEEEQFKIVVYNIRKLSYHDIILPPLHRFCVDINRLPIGVDLIQSQFFINPLFYLKKSNI